MQLSLKPIGQDESKQSEEGKPSEPSVSLNHSITPSPPLNERPSFSASLTATIDRLSTVGEDRKPAKRFKM